MGALSRRNRNRGGGGNRFQRRARREGDLGADNEADLGSNSDNVAQFGPQLESETDTSWFQALVLEDEQAGASTREGFTSLLLEELGSSLTVDDVLTQQRYTDPVTRAEAAAIVRRVVGSEPMVDPPARFVDVPDSHWAADDVYAAARDGILVGHTDGTFRPSDSLGTASETVVQRAVDPGARVVMDWEALAAASDGVSPDEQAYDPSGLYGEVFDAHVERLAAGVGIQLGSREDDLEVFTAHFEANRARYETVSAATDIPPAVIAALHWRESSGNFDTYLHQGDPIGEVSTHVPKGILFYDWETAAIDALESKGNVRDAVGITAETTNAAAIATFAEFYNGLGYHNQDRTSPYVYAGTDAYTSGKYVADGQYDAGHVDQQLGVLPMVAAIGGLDRELVGATPEEAWARVVSGELSLREGSEGPAVEALQQRLADLGYPVDVDGDFGKATADAVEAFQNDEGLSPVDGVVGPTTAARLG